MNEHLIQPSFALGEIKDKAIELTKKHWSTYLLIGLVGFAVIAPVEIVIAIWEAEYGVGIFSLVFSAISLVIHMILVVAITRYALAASKDKKLPLREYFTCSAKMVIAMAFASLLYMSMLFAGFVAMSVPGIILGIAFSFYSFPIVDKNMGTIDALKTSWNITKGNRMNIFIFWLVLAFAGLVAIAAPALIAMMPLLFNMQGAVWVAGILGILAVLWIIIAGIALETFGMIASAMMYHKMVATRK